MRCPFCQQELGDARLACPSCGRAHSPYVAHCLQQAWVELQRGARDRAGAAFDEAMRYTPAGDRPHLQHYISYLTQQAAPATVSRDVAAGMAALSPGETPKDLPGAQPAGAASVGAPQAVPAAQTVAAPRRGSARAPSNSGRWAAPVVLGAVLLLCLLFSMLSRWTWLLPFLLLIGGAIVAATIIGTAANPTDSAASARRALFLNFNERPSTIVKVMEDARTQQLAFARSRRTRQWLLALLFPAGLVFVILDLALGYNMQTFTLAGLALWAAAIIGMALLGRDKPTGKEFGPRFDVARQVFAAIKDDLAPGRTLVGWLDLTGPQPGKIHGLRPGLLPR